ncbi:hypothetical protein [Oscillatoria sp. FACHB-1406]|uniref:tetratricopeptide repeat protein n=1 Tax=Oscillatoria sp. FACHB-1406 TaxID=2692846 RepID=UPI001682DBC5|nr:hypothetical protein [Oscillatoria sp. FACHB-1406]MBD2580656.1 hypothetical protein [Oscillatoria sp. FACHB-1406]
MNFKRSPFKLTFFWVFFALLGTNLGGAVFDARSPLSFLSAALAQDSDEKPPSPLEIAPPDPLAPEGFLSPLRIKKFEQDLDALNARAVAELAAKNGDAAFEIWYRELRLWRILGRLEEVKALGRVGNIAWQESRSPDIKIITKRLNVIEAEVKTEGATDQAILGALATAYEQVREFKAAAATYNLILENARRENDMPTVERALRAQGELYLTWFDYPSAALVYEQLLGIARQQFDDFNTFTYLEKLAYIYDRSLETEKRENVKMILLEKAVEIGEQLRASYQKKQDVAKLLATQISLAQKYEALDRAEVASQIYQATFTLAWEQKQMARASEALQKLAELYEQHNQLDFAVQVYEEQAKVQTISGDRYGLMNTYDRIGLAHLQRRDPQQALSSFESGLQLARSLSYREAYFQTQIERIRKNE